MPDRVIGAPPRDWDFQNTRIIKRMLLEVKGLIRPASNQLYRTDSVGKFGCSQINRISHRWWIAVAFFIAMLFLRAEFQQLGNDL